MHHFQSVGRATLVFRELMPAFLSRSILSHKLTSSYCCLYNFFSLPILAVPPNYWNVLTEHPVHCKCNIQQCKKNWSHEMSEQLSHPSTVPVYKKSYIWQGTLNTFRTRVKHLENCWVLGSVAHVLHCLCLSGWS